MKPPPAFDCKTQADSGLIGAQGLRSPVEETVKADIPIGVGERGRMAAALESRPWKGEGDSTIPSPVPPTD